MHLLQIHEPGQTPLPHAGEQGIAIGIDLGTTHSVVAVSREGKVEVLRDICGGALVPSVVHYAKSGTQVGKEAKIKADAGDANTISSIKRRMGAAAESLEIGGKSRTPVEISADILRYLKKMAEEHISSEIKQAVITVPAYFDDAARTATKDAARLAGLEVLRLVNEPTAAALAYGLEHSAEGIYAIYDLGGGTFDISLLKLEKGVFQVLATGGDTALGGDDFDDALAKKYSVTKSEARKIKEQLSEAEKAGAATRAEFESLISAHISRTIDICKHAMEDAKVSTNDIKGVVLVGGSTRIPYVQKQVEACFGKAPLTNVNPDEVVAVGAALQAEGLTQGSDNLLLDVIPLSLGLETIGGLTEKLIQRNTPIPVSVSQEFTTYQDNQNGMVIHVLQGEREMVEQNRSLARFELKGIPPLPAGIARIKITFTVDADGLLSVSAEETTTAVQQSIHVKPSYGLPPEEMERMLRESMEHAQSDMTARVDAEAKMEAERSVIEIESALKADGHLLSDAEQKLIRIQIGYVREAIKEGDRDRMSLELHQLAGVSSSFAEKRMNTAITKALTGKKVSDAI